MQPPPKKLLDQVRDAIRLKHYAYRTEETYVQWIRRYILFHNKRHPKEMGKAEIEAFLTYLAVEGQVSASTQNQALSALMFLYREVLNLDIAGIDAVRAKRPQYVPTVLTKEEAIAVIRQCDGIYQLVVKLLYGSGLRLIEGLRLRVKDVDFAQQQIVVRDGKGSKSRVTMLPSSIAAELRDHLVGVQRQHLIGVGEECGVPLIWCELINDKRGAAGPCCTSLLEPTDCWNQPWLTNPSQVAARNHCPTRWSMNRLSLRFPDRSKCKLLNMIAKQANFAEPSTDP